MAARLRRSRIAYERHQGEGRPSLLLLNVCRALERPVVQHFIAACETEPAAPLFLCRTDDVTLEDIPASDRLLDALEERGSLATPWDLLESGIEQTVTRIIELVVEHENRTPRLGRSVDSGEEADMRDAALWALEAATQRALHDRRVPEPRVPLVNVILRDTIGEATHAWLEYGAVLLRRLLSRNGTLAQIEALSRRLIMSGLEYADRRQYGVFRTLVSDAQIYGASHATIIRAMGLQHPSSVVRDVASTLVQTGPHAIESIDIARPRAGGSWYEEITMNDPSLVNEHEGEFICIDTDDGAYEIGTRGTAIRKLLARVGPAKKGRLYTRRIGAPAVIPGVTRAR